jgi:hypothetical protein
MSSGSEKVIAEIPVNEDGILSLSRQDLTFWNVNQLQFGYHQRGLT